MEQHGLTLEGHRELQALFVELPKRVVNKGLRKAVDAGSAPILKAAKANAPRASGLLKRAMGRKLKSRKGTHTATVGARKGVSGTYKGRKRVPSRYLHLVNKGTKPHDVSKREGGKRNRGARAIGGKGWHPGAKAKPFLTEAYRSNKDNAVRIAGQKLMEVVESEAKKLGKR